MRLIEYREREKVEAFLKGSQEVGNKAQEETVREILDAVRSRGFEALREYTRRFDAVDLGEDAVAVTEEEMEEALSSVDEEVLEAMKLAIANVEAYHRKQMLEGYLEESEDGISLGQLIRPLERAGLYVPGGTAAYPSSVIMTAVPAKVAGVGEIVMISPPDRNGSLNPYTLAAAKLAGVHRIYKAGGAQGIAAMAYGAGPIPKVDKIVGPGNIYVTIAKKMVYGVVDIDMLAGPSEILVLADPKAPPRYIAADLLSQGEHDRLASAILVTTDRDYALSVMEETERQMALLDRVNIARESMENNGAVILVENMMQGLDFANAYGPEHLELAVEDPEALLPYVKNAGAVFMGYYTPEPVGDYFAGPNHVLPTNGTSRFYSPLNTHTFLKKTSVISYSKEAIRKYGGYIEKLAEVEGFGAHRNAITVRMKDE